MTPRNAHRRRSQRTRPARAGADRLSLWRLCGRAACRHAKACRGDPITCVGLMREWLGALAASDAAPVIEAAERRTMTPQELRTLRLWRTAVEEADVKPAAWNEADAVALRRDLAQRLKALAKQEEWEQAQKAAAS